MRTVGPDGGIQQKANYEYVPGHYGPQQTDTTYWPGGKVQKIVRHTYDESTNFTGEFIQVFDQSGKQVDGHELTHDPRTGVYRCADWNVQLQKYRSVACPAGEEESGGGNEQAPKFTYEEVIKNLEGARKRLTAGHAQFVHSNLATLPDIGLVLPAQLRPGERVSGTVVADAKNFADVPGIQVVQFTVPSEFGALQLSSLQVEVEGETPQPADGPITFIIRRKLAQLKITLQQSVDPKHSVSAMLPVTGRQAKSHDASNLFQAPALCMKGELCLVGGSFGGDSHKIFAAFGDRPAPIAAETTSALYLSVPDDAPPGAQSLFLQEGPNLIALPVTIGELSIQGNGRELKAGDSLIVSASFGGPGDIPDAAWQPGNFPPTNLATARRFIPTFQLPKQERDPDREREDEEENSGAKEKHSGEILLILRNDAAGQVSLHNSVNQMLIFRLSDEAFRRGDFKYNLWIEAGAAGPVNIKSYVIPFLAPVNGQQFAVKASGQ